jgi:hypothetical protein
MKSTTLWNQKLGMLMACASPGSALAFHLGVTSNETDLMRRTQAADGGAGGLFARLERWFDKLEQQERERYLAQAQTVADLEARMRNIDTGRFWLP